MPCLPAGVLFAKRVCTETSDLLKQFFYPKLYLHLLDLAQMKKTTEGFIEVTGGRVWYKKVAVDSGEGLPLLVLHGGPGATHDYLEPLEELANERPVFFYDQLGGGNSDRPDDRSLWNAERFIAELATVRKFLGLERLFILGSSWGAALAVAYMLQREPSGVEGLVLSGPLLSTSRWIADQRKYISQMPKASADAITECEAKSDFASSKYQAAMLEFYKRHLCRLDVWPECLNRTLEKMGAEVYNTMWGASEFTMSGNLSKLELAEDLKKIDVPILITCGEFDESTPSTCRYFQSCAKNAELRIFSGASHSHHLEKTGEYLAAIGDFMRNHSSTEKL